MSNRRQPESEAEYAAFDQVGGDERDVELLAEDNLARWRVEGASALSTLDLRATAHAAERVGDTDVSHELAAAVDAREAKGETG